MDQSQVVIPSSFSFWHAFDLFRSLALRHLPIVNHKMKVVGIVTRHDFAKYHSLGMNALSYVPMKPKVRKNEVQKNINDNATNLKNEMQ